MAIRRLSELVGTSPTNVPKKKALTFDESKINWEKLKQCSIFLATPCYGGMVTDQYFLSAFRLSGYLATKGINLSVTTLRNESLIPRGRNILTAMFLESGFSHFLFVDADIEFPPESVVRMLSMDKPLIAAAYPKKALPIEHAINVKRMDPIKNTINVDENGAVELLDASTGFFMVRRDCLEKMIAAYPHLHYKNDTNIDPKYNKHCYSLFDCVHDPVDNRYLSEDYTFCRRWQQIGGKIWLDPYTKLNHVGSYTFEGDPLKYLQQFNIHEE